MRLQSPGAASAGLLLFGPRLAIAASALWLQPSSQWHGDDGNWSAISVSVGSPPQTVDLFPGTNLSETWVVENTGCPPNAICYAARGGVFFPQQSTTWRSIGAWELLLQDVSPIGNGDYGLDTMTVTNTITNAKTVVNDALIAAINSSDYLVGSLGLGVMPGKFNETFTSTPYISQLAETYGTIPSHSYGFTAGAFYRNGGTPASLTLGGYDSLRFTPSAIDFALEPTFKSPLVHLRGVTANVPSVDKAPAPGWTSTSMPLVTMNDSITAVIDSTTPFLWLPEEICDRFAAALNLTWNDNFQLYLIEDADTYNRYRGQSNINLTFSLSSTDNADDFGHPLDVHGVVNITLPSAAFAQVISYPFPPIQDMSDPSIPYFPLIRWNQSLAVIGRMFMQEAYMIVNYDINRFSINPALFPDNPATNHSLVDIPRDPHSLFPAFVDKSSSQGLTPAETAAIVVSIFVLGLAAGLAFWFWRRRSKQRRSDTPESLSDVDDDEKTQVEDEQPKNSVSRILSRITRRKRSRKTVPENKVPGSSERPVEVGADATHAVYEMPVPLEPVELDSGTHDDTDDLTQLGTESSQGLSAYEVARRKLERQLQGPLPTYTPPPPGTALGDDEKSHQDVSPVAHYRPSDEPSPVSSPSDGQNSNELPHSLPSPITPHGEWQARLFDLPSPMTLAPPLPSPRSPSNTTPPGSTYSSPVSPVRTFDPSSISRSDSSSGTRRSPISPVHPPPAIYQRTPIDPSRVICLGPLPEDVQLPRSRPTVPRLVAPDGRSVSADSRNAESDTLGSNFTVEEATRMDGGITGVTRSAHSSEANSPQTPRSLERIDAGNELIHVPQLAEKRYSWEEDTK